PLDRDLFLALFTETERTFFDLLESLLDLVEEALLSAAETEGEALEVFARGEVHLVGQIVRVERHVVVQGLLCSLDDFVSFRLEQRLELLELGLGHVDPRSSFRSPRGKGAQKGRQQPSPRQGARGAVFLRGQLQEPRAPNVGCAWSCLRSSPRAPR